MQRAQQITFGVSYGISSFPHPEALVALADLADFTDDRDFWVMNDAGKPRLVTGAPDGAPIFARGVIREDASDGNPLEETVDEANGTGRPVMEYHRPDGTTRVVYPISFKTAEPYEGRIYRQFKSDCYSLMRDYLADTRGIVLPTGTIEEADALAKRLGRSYLETAFDEYGFEPVAKARTGDIALIVPQGDIPHIAILIDDCANILHHPARRLSCVTPYSGYWLRNTVALYRRDA
ncbi:C40 family peptidase [Salipiger pacificus]|nr:C40 family peptidase [Alloyangia pacifica]